MYLVAGDLISALKKITEFVISLNAVTLSIWHDVTSDGVIEDMSLASSILEVIFEVLGLGLGLGI